VLFALNGQIAHGDDRVLWDFITSHVFLFIDLSQVVIAGHTACFRGSVAQSRLQFIPFRLGHGFRIHRDTVVYDIAVVLVRVGYDTGGGGGHMCGFLWMIVGSVSLSIFLKERLLHRLFRRIVCLVEKL